MQIKEYDSEGKQTGTMLTVCDLIKTRKLFRDKQMEMREHRKRKLQSVVFRYVMGGGWWEY